MAPSRGGTEEGTIDGYRYVAYKPARANGSRLINILGAGPGGSKLTTRTKPGELIEAVIRAKLAECSNNASPGAASPLAMGHEDCADAADDVPATSPHFSPRRSKRARTDTLENKFSPSAGWSNYEKNRVGARHDRARALTYQQAIALMSELRGHLSRIVNLEGAEHYMPQVIEALQLAPCTARVFATGPATRRTGRSWMLAHAASSSIQVRGLLLSTWRNTSPRPPKRK